MDADEKRAGWRIQLDDAAEGGENMARDQEMMDLAARSFSTARIYFWSRPTVSLGYFQAPAQYRPQAGSTPENYPKSYEGPPPSGFLPNALAALSVPLVVRPTGGKAVLHGHDLTVSLACPLDRINAESTAIKHIYRQLAKPIIIGLNEAGIDAVLGEEFSQNLTPGRTADCFAHVSANDIVHRDSRVKLVGSALRVAGGAVLMQCSIPVRPPMVPPESLFVLPHRVMPLDVDEKHLAASLVNCIARFGP